MQIFHTGREEYDRPSGWNFDAAEFARQYGQDQVAIEKYKQAVIMQREQEFMKLLDVNTDNLIFEKYQAAAGQEIDAFMKEATKYHNDYGAYLSMEDKIKLLNNRHKMQMKIDGLRSKAEQFLKERDVYASSPENFDVEETNAKFKEFIDDPINKLVPQAVPKYYDPIYLLRKELDTTYKWQPPSKGRVVKKADGTWSKTVRQTRTGIETEEQARDVAYNIFKNNYQVERGVGKAYQGDFEKFFNDAKPHLMPREYEDTGSSSSLSFGGGFSEKNIDFNILEDGTLAVTGNPLDVTWSVDGQSRKLKFVGMNPSEITFIPSRSIDEPDYEMTEQILKLAGKDNSTEEGVKEAADYIKEKKASDPQAKMVLNIYKRIFDLNALIQVDGKWYFKKRAQEIKVPTTDANLRDLQKVLGGYSKFKGKFDIWKGQYFKHTQPVSEPNAESEWDKYKR